LFIRWPANRGTTAPAQLPIIQPPMKTTFQLYKVAPYSYWVGLDKWPCPQVLFTDSVSACICVHCTCKQIKAEIYF